MTREKKILIGTIAVLIFIAVASVAAILMMYFGKSDHVYAEIYQDGKLIRTIDLSDPLVEETFTVSGEEGAYNKIQVKDGGISVIEANCPDLLCMHMGEIRTNSLPITCLPNKLVIQIKAGSLSEEKQPDVFTY